MARAPLALCLLLAASFAVTPALAQYPDPQRAPQYYPSDCAGKYDKHFVYDYLALVPADLAREAEGAACEVYALTSAHAVLVTVPDTAGETLENYALHLFERWGLGDRARNDGLLLLYVADGSAVRVEVGYGLEGVVNAHTSQLAISTMQDAKQRALDAGQGEREALGFALASGDAFLLGTLRDSYHDGAFPKPSPPGPPWWFWLVVALFLLLVVVSLAQSAKSKGGRRGWATPSDPFWTGAGAGWVGSSGSSGSDWGGGGSFGGGLSGGGGGSGRL